MDFGASDAPLSTSQFAACKRREHCLQIPWALAGTAVVYNARRRQQDAEAERGRSREDLPRADQVLERQRDQGLNKGVSIPHTAISVFHRSDGRARRTTSPTTCRRFGDWKAHVGTGTAVSWPAGTGESHSSGVAAAVAATNGGIGYIDVEYAIPNHLKYAAMQNRDGKFVLPTLASIKAASKIQPKPQADGSLSIVNPPATAAVHRTRIRSARTRTWTLRSRARTPRRSRSSSAGRFSTRPARARPTARRFSTCRSRPASSTFDQKQIAKIHT